MFAFAAIHTSSMNAQAGVNAVVCGAQCGVGGAVCVQQTNILTQVGGLLLNGTQLLGDGLQEGSR